MLTFGIQLQNPGLFRVEYKKVNPLEFIGIRPLYMAICHADQRYYRGLRNRKILEKKLPMALIHECCGEVYFDSTGKFKCGQKVVLIPNVPSYLPANEIFENYQSGCKFMSSGIDGFMQELIFMEHTRLVPFDFDESVAAIVELISVCVHAVNRLLICSHSYKNKIGIWGDGSVAYLTSLVISKMIPDSEIYVIGKHETKLAFFTFVEKSYFNTDIPFDFKIDHAFECAGGTGSSDAISDIIKYINPQGSIILMGVSEEKILINTRDILEKGLTFIGASRSGYNDFKIAVNILSDPEFVIRVKNIIYEDEEVKNISDIHRVFKNDINTLFKTVFKWGF